MKIKELLEGKDATATKIARGICVNSARFVSVEAADKVLNGTLTADEALAFLSNGTAGEWWYLLGGDDNVSVEDAKEFAKQEDDLTQGFGKFQYEELRDGEEDSIEVEFPLVLIAKRPKGWTPSDNDLVDGGLNGNSYIDTKKWKSVELIAIQYLTKDGWVEKDAKGRTVKL